MESVERRPSPFRSSFTLEEWDVSLAGGELLKLLFKDVSAGALLQETRPTKPAFLSNPERELCVYRTILAGADLGTPVCYAAVADRGQGRYWLWLERVEGQDLRWLGESEHWQAAARWLARLHALSVWPECAAHLLRYDGGYFRLWLGRALAFHADQPILQKIAAGYERIVERLGAMPPAFIHGEYYAANVVIVPAEGEGQTRVCAVDWETAAIGPGLLDLAALTAGNWSEAERAAMSRAYYAEAPARPGWPPSPAEFDELLDCCRLHLALQWLGWGPGWAPPPEHACDWLGEAARLAERLGL
jgi:aminoglycoside phosphotransferase (APT) family kinase protein